MKSCTKLHPSVSTASLLHYSSTKISSSSQFIILISVVIMAFSIISSSMYDMFTTGSLSVCVCVCLHSNWFIDRRIHRVHVLIQSDSQTNSMLCQSAALSGDVFAINQSINLSFIRHNCKHDSVFPHRSRHDGEVKSTKHCITDVV